MLLCKADITRGKCPTVREKPFNCTKILNGLNPNASNPDPHKLVAYAFLPSAIRHENLNIFAFHMSLTNINGFTAHLYCKEEITSFKEDMMIFLCDGVV